MKRPAIIENRPCVYMIKNTVNGKVYIGSSVNGNRRYSRHLYELKKGTHHTIRLQKAFNKYGVEAFVFMILKYTEKNNLRKEESRILKMLDTSNPEKGYNSSSLDDLGIIEATESSKEKMRESQKARYINMTDEDRAALIKKRSEAMAKKCSRPIVCSNGTRFDSLADAAKHFNTSRGNIRRLIKKQRPGGVSGCGKYSKLNGLSFKYAEETENVR